ncbi:MAG: tetratricopeptide repeat protein [Phycisphaerae bacterium]|jgi:tetratricopeptide (TPR) repeat protein
MIYRTRFQRLAGPAPGRRDRRPWLLAVVFLLAVVVGATDAAPLPQDAPAGQVALRPLAEVPAAPAGPAQPCRELTEQPALVELYVAAQELVDAGDYAAAAARLNQMFDLAEGDYYELPYLMAVALYHLGDVGQARALAERAVALRPAGADVHYLLGIICRGSGELDVATQHFRSATLADEPDNERVTAAWFHLGECLLVQGWSTAAEEAFAHFDEAVAQASAAQRSKGEVAAVLVDCPRGGLDVRLDLLWRLDRPVEALQIAEDARVRTPDDPRVASLCARALLAADRPAEAFALGRERLAEAAPTTAPAEGPPPFPQLTLTVQAALAAEQLDPWLDELIAGLDAGESAALATAVADRLDELKQPAAAARLWQALAAKDPDDADVAWALAVSRRNEGLLDQAVADLIAFVRAHPNVSDVSWRRQGAWLASFPSPDRLMTIVSDLRAAPDTDFATDFVLGTGAAAAGQAQLAEDLLHAAVEARPDFALGHVAWGQWLLAQYRWDDALTHAEAALSAAPDLAAAHFVAGSAHAGLDQHEQAESAFHDALTARSDEPDFALALADHYRRTSNPLAAQRYYQQALAADPRDGRALEELVDSYVSGGKLELARLQLRRAEARDVAEDALRRARTTIHFAMRPFQEEHLAELARQCADVPDDVETALKLAAGLYVRNRPNDAFPYVERVLARAPDDERAISLMARVRTRRLEQDRAIELLERLATRYPNRVDVRSALAEVYLAAFRVDEARRAWEWLLEAQPAGRSRHDDQQRLVLSYIEFSEYDEALRLLDEWIAADPDADDWPLEKLHVLILADRPQEAVDLAIARLDPAEDLFSEKLTELRAIVDQFQADPENEELRSRGERLQTEAEQARDALLARRAEFVQVCLDADRPAVAEQHIRGWLAIEPGDAQDTQWLIQTLLEDDRPEDALRALDQFHPGSPLAEIAARGWRARAQAAAGRVDEAVETMQALLEEGPTVLPPAERGDVWQQYMQLLAADERFDEALQVCNDWFADSGRSDPAARVAWLGMRSSILQLAGRTEEYLESAEQWYELDPDNIGLNNDLGYSWVEQGLNLERATGMIRLAVAAQPLRAAYLDSLGWAYYRAGDFGAAHEYLERATRLAEGQDPVLYDHLADAAYRLGDVDAARRHWQKVLTLIEEHTATGTTVRPDTLVADVRAKLAALERSAPPAVAPTVSEAAEPPE